MTEKATLLALLTENIKATDGISDKSYEVLKSYFDLKKDLLEKKITKVLNQEYQLGLIEDPLLLKIKTLEESNTLKLKKQIAEKHKNSYLWVTINPDPKVTLGTFVKTVKRIASYSCFKSYIYVFEQRGTIKGLDIGKGFHAHLLLERNLSYKPTACRQKVARGCLKIIGNVLNSQWLNFATIGKEFAADKYTYMTALKCIEKQEKQEADQVFRKKNKLEHVYKNNISPDIINAQEKS